MEPICTGGGYESECLIYPEAVKWREERRLRKLNEHCPFASNAVCGKPWLWLCKAHGTYFPLTEVEEEDGRPMRGDGGYVYKEGKSVENIREACLSGDTAVYEGCPNYKDGVEYREYIKRVKKGEKT